DGNIALYEFSKFRFDLERIFRCVDKVITSQDTPEAKYLIKTAIESAKIDLFVPKKAN
ncbi:MAG: hypothetical protein MHPSP_002692, partial [Paramarteilia canceri]